MTTPAIHDPFRAAEALKRAYLGYLRDALPIHPTQPRLRAMVDEKIDAADAFCREPMVSALPAWEAGHTPAQMIARREPPFLSEAIGALVDTQRPLYTHQVEAITRVQAGRNVVVATGTGSGKTECFLYPLVDRALSSGEPMGVQAIFIYPMNALANDQLARMRAMLGHSAVTFGRYTGQTPKDNLPEGHPDLLYDNERVTRPEIQQRPPQLLLTNFAMLEYLLLRPDDQQIFRHDRVHTVVLDEAHAYRGSQGIDISLLMRRLRHRFKDKLRFILTSATIGDEGEAADEKIAVFASGLTGAQFTADDVIRGVRSSPFHRDELVDIQPSALESLHHDRGTHPLEQMLKDPAYTRSWLADAGLKTGDHDKTAHLLHEGLSRCRALEHIHRVVIDRPSSPTGLSDHLRTKGIELSSKAVASLLLLAANAMDPVSGAPLFPARIHQFFRGLQGVSVQLHELEDLHDMSDPNQRVKSVVMQEEGQAEGGGPLWPLWVCNACGMPAVMAVIGHDESVTPARTKDKEGLGLLTWMDPALIQEDAEIGGPDDEQAADEDASLSAGSGLVLIPKVKTDGSLSRCPCCGAGAGQFDSVMRRFATGEDAPTAVLAEELLRQLPVTQPELPAGGRKLLAFSDSRQRAAFFAPYLNQTIAHSSFVQPLLRAVGQAETNDEPLSLVEWPTRAQDLALEHDWVVFRRRDDEDGSERYDARKSREMGRGDKQVLRDELAAAAYEHITGSPSRRNLLPALMVAAAEIDLSPGRVDAFNDALGPLLPDAKVRDDLIQRLLSLVLRRYAVTFDPFKLNRRDLVYGRKGPAAAAVHKDPSLGKSKEVHLFRWNPFLSSHAKNALRVSRQAEQVVKALNALSIDPTNDRVDQILESVWDVMTEADSGLMESMGQGRFRLDAGNILIRQAGPWYKCDRCDARTRFRMGGTCEIFQCTGRLVEVPDPDGDRRASRLVQRYGREPLPARVAEHTAQLTLERGREYQDQFTKGQVNVLSCSTTFEMGVDVGDLDSVFLRNVPPSTANYVQRVGRAGRRNQALAHAVTFAHATPHDQHHYFDPAAIAAGKVPVPVVYTANPVLAQRHINAYLLSRFWPLLSGHDGARLQVASADNPDSGFFSVDPGCTTCASAKFDTWCKDDEDHLAREVSQLVDSGALGSGALDLVRAARVSLVGSSVADRNDSVWHRGLVLPCAAFNQQAAELEEDAKQAAADGEYRRADAITQNAERIRRMQRELCSEDLIGFLAGQHWLPNYAFPQDSVRLLVRQDGQSARLRMERSRAMGIVEYAPGAEVIVDGQLIRSTALDLEKREPVLHHFQDLGEGRVRLFGAADGAAPRSTNTYKYIEPRGFSTNIDEPIERPNLFRKRPSANSPVYLVKGAGNEDFARNEQIPAVLTALDRRGSLFTANFGPKTWRGRARGYLICTRCGSQVQPGSKSHQTAWGRQCTGKYEPVMLAHQFHTAVLQVRFPSPTPPTVAANYSFWKSLATGIESAACKLLDIERGDLCVDYRSLENGYDGAELFIYDNIPGGAGYAERVQQHFRSVLDSTEQRLLYCENPECVSEGSCYACLRSYHNQFVWDQLSRAEPLQWLQLLLR